MANTLIRDVVIIGVIGLVTAWGLNNREQLYTKFGLTSLSKSEQVKSEQSASNAAVKTPETSSTNLTRGSVVAIPKNKGDGQYWTDARVNNGYVRFLVDTGAGSVALTFDDAKKAGIRVQDLKYNVPISTAGGRNYAAAVTLKNIAVGGINLRNVRALVVKDGLHVSLLGMTYLGQLQKVEATPNSLILRL